MTFAFDEVFLARHGQTVWNVERRRQGHLDSPLTDQGLSQAGNTAAMTDTIRADAIFTSPWGAPAPPRGSSHRDQGCR